MLNGKFYTGLPEKMMTHRSGPNRQKTNFYWPDESDMEQVVDSKTKLRSKSKKELAPERSDSKDLNPNTLFKKELSSKIEFHDEMDKKERNPIVKDRNPIAKAVDSPIKPNNTNIKIRDAFASKIQFYDFEDDSKSKTNNIKVEVEKNTKNSTKTCSKRISFNDNKLQDKNLATQNILKNNAFSTIDPSSMQLSSTARSNLSKSRSMTDIPAKDNLNMIENNVKNISISHNRNQKCHKRDEPAEELLPRRILHRSPLRDGPISRRTRPVAQYSDSGDNDYYYSHQIRSNPQYQTITKNYEIIPDDLQSSSGNKKNAHQYYNETMDRRINGGYYGDGYYDYAPPSPSRRSITKPKLRPGDLKPILHKIDRNPSPQYPVNEQHEASPDIQNIDNSQKLNNFNLTRNITETPPRKVERAHRHLVSNIEFGTDFMNDNTPKSIRNSAVTRVSVGLPNS